MGQISPEDALGLSSIILLFWQVVNTEEQATLQKQPQQKTKFTT